LTRSFCRILLVILLLGVTSISAHAQAFRIGPSMTAMSGIVRGSSVAYDYIDNMYLVVSAHGNLNGRFISGDGTLLGLVTIQPAAVGFSQYPGVAYSPDAFDGAGGFLVAWHQSQAVGAVVHARMVSTTGVVGPETQISTEGSWWEATADIAYSTISQEFLVVWQGAGIRGQRIGNSGEMLGTNLSLTGPDYHRDPSIAYNPNTNEYMLVYGGVDALGAYAAARRVAPETGALLGTETLLNRAGAVYITEVAYDSITNRFLTAWYQGGTFGRVLDAAGNYVTPVVVLGTRFTSYDGLGLDFSPGSGTYVMVAQDSQSFQNGAVEITADGVADAGIVATDIATNNGNYYPKVAARLDKGEWLLSTATGFTATSVQRIGSNNIGVPPPPPCTATPTITSLQVPSGQTSFSINVTADPTCAWRARSSASWLQIFYGAKTTGAGFVGVTALHNTAMAARSATITIGAVKVTIVQSGFNAGALTDFNSDGLSDALWQSSTTRSLAIWTFRGNTVTSIQWLDTLAPSGTSWKIAGTGDLNGDGFADLVWHNTSDGTVAVWIMRGTTFVGSAVVNYSPLASGWNIRGVGDVNGDGRADLIFQHNDGSLAVWLMNGVNAIAAMFLSIPKVADTNWVVAGAGDVNGDGMADLVWQNKVNGGLGVWYLNGPTVIDTKALSIVAASSLSWKIHGVGDVNGDAMADLLWQNETTGDVAVWYLNGFVVLGGQLLSISNVGDLSWNMVGPG
jgi:VCBS repeat protein